MNLSAKRGLITVSLLALLAIPAAHANPATLPMVGVALQPAQTPAQFDAADHYPDPSFQPTNNNQLVVDAATGAILSWQNNGAPYTDIRVDGVTPDGKDYRLTDPNNVQVFINKTAAPDGSLAFGYMVAQPGTWFVTQGPYKADQKPLVGFVVPTPTTGIISAVGAILPHLFATTRVQYSGYQPPPNCGPYVQEVETHDYQTLLAALHAPFPGSSTMSQGYSSTTTVYAGSWGTSGVTENGFKLQTTNGDTTGAFEPARWGLYMHGNSCQDWGGAKTYHTAVDYWYNGVSGIDFPGDSRSTDADDWINVEYPGVFFDHQYKAPSGGLVDTTKTQNTLTEYSRAQMTNSFAASIQFNAGSLPLAASAQSDQSTTDYYDYSFPSGHQWDQDVVRSNGQGYAFCTPQFNNC